MPWVPSRQEVEHARGNASAGRSAGLHGLDFRFADGPAADVVDDFLYFFAQGHLDKPGVSYLAHERENLGARVFLYAGLRIFVRAHFKDNRDIGPCLDVVDCGRLTVYPALDGERRALARLPGLAFNRMDERGLLAAHERARTLDYLEVERETGAEYVLSQEPEVPGLAQGYHEMFYGQGILGTHVQHALCGPGSVGGDYHAFDDAVRVPLEYAAVHVSAGVALVGVADEVLAVIRRLFCEQLPL
jgi:hypothetical protein